MKYLKSSLFLLSATVILSCSGEKKTEDKTKDTNSSENEWISLFDGETFNGWEMYGPEPITEHWEIDNGTIACNKEAGESNVGFFRSIMTTRDFGNFELELEYKIAKGGNSGIFYHVVESDSFGHDYMTGPEYQVLDDEFSRSESEAYKMVASNYSMHAPAETKKPNPYMQWNKVKIVYNDGHVEHWLNGEKVLEFEEGNEAWLETKAKSKWANTPSYAASKTGRISLQNHGDAVWYRNIRVREL
jgi:hypothetical protein